MKLTRQARVVLDHLRTNPHLTSWQAEGVYRIRRLASRIDELRAAGFEIEKQRCEDATGQAYTRYSLSRRQKRAKRPLLQPRVSQRRFDLDQIEHHYSRFLQEVIGYDATSAFDEAVDFTSYLKENA